VATLAKLYLLRHGKVAGPAALYGHTDVLVGNAINQNIVENFLKQKLDIGHIVSSPLSRCLSLAKAIQNERSVELSVIDDLKEMDFGLYDGIAFDEVYQDKTSWQRLEQFWQNPGSHTLAEAEQLSQFNRRITTVWQQILSQHSDQQKNGNTLVVCHGGVIRMILADILQIDINNARWYSQLGIGYGSLTTLDLINGDLLIKQIAQPLLDE